MIIHNKASVILMIEQDRYVQIKKMLTEELPVVEGEKGFRAK